MTPEQQDLLFLKCQKTTVKDADLISTAIHGVISGFFGKKSFTPSDLLDKGLGFHIDLDDLLPEHRYSHIKELTPTLRRKLRFSDKGWSDERALGWLLWMNQKHGGGYDIWEYFTPEELDKVQFHFFTKPEQGGLHGTNGATDAKN